LPGLLPVLNRIWPSGWAWQPEQPAYLHMIFSNSFSDPGPIGHLWGDVAGLYVTAIVLTLLARSVSREAVPV
jgi:hypothetical protein